MQWAPAALSVLRHLHIVDLACSGPSYERLDICLEAPECRCIVMSLTSSVESFSYTLALSPSCAFFIGFGVSKHASMQACKHEACKCSACRGARLRRKLLPLDDAIRVLEEEVKERPRDARPGQARLTG